MNFDVACYSEQGGRMVNEDAVMAAGTVIFPLRPHGDNHSAIAIIAVEE